MNLIGKTAKIDLTTKSIEIKKTSISDVKHFLGARGINVLELYKILTNPSKIDAFNPQNPLIFGVGLLTGTLAPNAARFNVTALSPETGILGDANAGGFFGPAMKYAGYDRLIVVGKSDTPVYLLLEESGITIKNASNLWGQDTQTTQKMLWNIEGTEVETACIGPAGENLVRMACIINRKKNSASRGGMGAVMGSKNLKAVVARGTGSLKVYQPEKFMEYMIELKDYLNDSRIVQTLRSVGTPLLYEPSNLLGAIRAKNSQITSFDTTLNASEFHKFSTGAVGCAACIIHCRHTNIQGGEGPEYSTIGLLGANCGLSDPNQVILLNNMCNELGLDTSSTGTIIAWFIEMDEKGMLPKAFANSLEFGNFGLIQSLLIQITYRQGIGDLMAESSQYLSQLEGRADEANSFLIASKGLPQSDPHDCRYIKSFALGIGTSSRGADHLRSRPTIELFDLPADVTTKIYGKKVDTNPTSYNDKGWIVAFHESIYAVGDALGICRFVTHSFNSPKLLKYKHFSKLVEQGTGIRIENYRSIGDRIINLERMFNLKCGITRKDDYPPARYMNEPASHGVAKGHLIERDKYDNMLDEYYETRGWSKKGIPNEKQQDEIMALMRGGAI